MSLACKTGNRLCIDEKCKKLTKTRQLLPWQHLKCCYAAAVVRLINSMILKLLPWQHMATTIAMATSEMLL